MPTDSYYYNTSLVLPLEGENNSTTITDLSQTPKTVTRVGNTKISTAQSKWGSGSGYFDGNGDRLSINHAALKSGTADFTVEMWVYLNAHKDYTVLVCTQTSNSNADGYAWGLAASGQLFIYVGSFPYWSTGTVATGGWRHLAMVRSGNTVRFYVNGVQDATTWSTSGNFSGGPFVIGGISWNDGQSVNGYLQDVRFTNAARYTANFTPPGRLSSLYQIQSVAGQATVSGNGGADQVAIHDASNRQLIATATPNATTGAWTASVPPGDYTISYFAASCRPVTHGPYPVAPS